MPRRAKGPRLYLDTKRKQWVIRDGPNFVRTGAGEGERSAADKALAQYIAHKYRPEPSGVPMIGDVLAVYGAEAAPHKKSARNIRLPNTQSIAVLGREDGRQHHSKVLPRLCRHEGKDGRTGRSKDA